MNIYLANIQALRCAKNKDPLCIPWSARRVKDLAALLVQELAILDYDFIVLSFFLHEVYHGILAIHRVFYTNFFSFLCSANTYWTKVFDALALKL